ncbi:hypothetical protein ACFRCW_27350 [Streptomyces sp. NPDC056653]|uniref:hypothetical protein n=1 Tax=Streptomyces sp. NPDC056653 TaxID=3345894 RepID=UPI0036883CAD
MGDENRGEAAQATDERRLWQVKIALVATSEQHEEVLDRLSDVLCPDSDHEGPCPLPWAMHSVNEDSLSAKQRKALLEEIEETNWDPEGRPIPLDPPLGPKP